MGKGSQVYDDLKEYNRNGIVSNALTGGNVGKALAGIYIAEGIVAAANIIAKALGDIKFQAPTPVVNNNVTCSCGHTNGKKKG